MEQLLVDYYYRNRLHTVSILSTHFAVWMTVVDSRRRTKRYSPHLPTYLLTMTATAYVRKTRSETNAAAATAAAILTQEVRKLRGEYEVLC